VTGLSHTPLDVAALSPAAQKALAPGPARMMAARGLAPLPRPGDLISVLYQLAHDGDEATRQAAADSAGKLPPTVLAGGLADAAVDPRVLDWFAARVADRAELIEAVVLNPSTADPTVEALVARAQGSLVDLIAQNEERLLRAPGIIGAMYSNPNARMSTVDRAVELAVRNKVKVPGIPAWEELSHAVLQADKRKPDPAAAAAADQIFSRAAQAVASRGDAKEPAEGEEPDERDVLDEKQNIPYSEMTIPMKIRLATLGNSFSRAVLVRDSAKMVALAAIKAPGVTEMEAMKYASNHSLVEDVIAYIANRREWTKLYGVKLALVQNPKTPITASSRMLAHLREKDLRQVARSKGVPSSVTANARKLLMQRTPSGKGKS
jgi:hypothetical protein